MSRLTLAQEFPARTTQEILRMNLPRPLRDIELALQWLYLEQAGEIAYAPPRAGIDIRRDIRQTRIRLRSARRKAA